MQRIISSFSIDEIVKFKQQLLCWSQQFQTAIFLDSNNYHQQYSSFDAVLAVDEFTCIKTDFHSAFEKLQEYQTTTKDYIFGYISYDVKNDIEQLSSTNFDGLDFADLFFFQPQKIIFVNGNSVEFHYLKMVDDEIDIDFNAIQQSTNTTIQQSKPLDCTRVDKNSIKIKLRIHKDEYHQKVTTILQHIQRGDIYEANFCQEFYAENTEINPLKVYQDLNRISEPPFAVFLKMNHQYLLSASPERYLRKEGNKIISQPIKATAKRLKSKFDDEKIASDLARDSKERTENVMIVDLVRNDLSKSAIKGSVKVEELCKVYSFKQVHQMISTVVSEMD